MTDEVSVTQADRDAAALALGYKSWDDATDYRLSGAAERTRDDLVQAFARHRVASEQSRIGWTKAELGKWAEGWSRTPATTLKAFIDAGLCSDQSPAREETRLVRRSTSQPTPSEGLASIIRTAVKLRHRDASDDYNTGFNNGLKAAETSILSALRSTPPAPSEVADKPVARAHIGMGHDGLHADLEVLDGSQMQPEHSPVDLYLRTTHSPAEVEAVATAIKKVTGGVNYDYMDFCRDAARAAIAALPRHREFHTAPLAKPLLTLVHAMREYLPSDGISKDEFIDRIIGALDNDGMAKLIGELEGRK